MEHPLKVHHPGEGNFFLLLWWTHDEQWQIVVARSIKALDVVANRIILTEPDVRFGTAYEVEFLAPSDHMCQEALRAQHMNDVKTFMNDITYGLQDVYSVGKPLPSMFVKCKKFTPDYLEDGEEDKAPDSYVLRMHPSCRNCLNGFELVDCTPESLYDRYRDRWAVLYPKVKYTNPRYPVLLSRARQVTDSEKLWVAEPNFGHHAHGVQLTPFASLCHELDVPFNREVLFYFRIIRELDRSVWDAAAEAHKAKEKERQKSKGERFKVQREQERLATLTKVLSIFEE